MIFVFRHQLVSYIERETEQSFLCAAELFSNTITHLLSPPLWSLDYNFMQIITDWVIDPDLVQHIMLTCIKTPVDRFVIDFEDHGLINYITVRLFYSVA